MNLSIRYHQRPLISALRGTVQITPSAGWGQLLCCFFPQWRNSHRLRGLWRSRHTWWREGVTANHSSITVSHPWPTLLTVTFRGYQNNKSSSEPQVPCDLHDCTTVLLLIFCAQKPCCHVHVLQLPICRGLQSHISVVWTHSYSAILLSASFVGLKFSVMGATSQEAMVNACLGLLT